MKERLQKIVITSVERLINNLNSMNKKQAFVQVKGSYWKSGGVDIPVGVELYWGEVELSGKDFKRIKYAIQEFAKKEVDKAINKSN